MVRLSIRLLFESYINTTIVEDRKNEIFYDTKNGNQNFLLKILNKKYYKNIFDKKYKNIYCPHHKPIHLSSKLK